MNATLGGNQDQSKAVVAFAANGLEGGTGYAGLCGGEFDEATHAEHGWIAAGAIEEGTLSDQVVHNDQAAAA